MGKTEVTEDDFSLDELRDGLVTEEDGAVVVFNGVVRGNSDGEEVRRLEMERYEDMTLKELEKVKDETLLNFDVTDLNLIHRHGKFDVGENIVCIMASAPHRKEAFEACEYCIDRLKEKVPLWKKEITEEGVERWLKGQE